MSGSGIVYAVACVSDQDDARVWRLWIGDGPGNADARSRIAANRTVISDVPAHVAVNIDRSADADVACPILVGDAIRWDAHRVWRGADEFRKVGFEYDPDAPLSPP